MAGERSGSTEALRSLQLIAGALLASSLVTVAVCAMLGPLVGPEAEPTAARTIAFVATGYAVMSPLLAARLTSRGDTAAPPSVADRRRAVILRFAILESAATLCAAALILAPLRWPLLAAAVPVGAMVASFPRSQD